MLLCVAEYAGHTARKTVPALSFRRQLLRSRPLDAIDSRAPLVLRHHPLSRDPSGLFHAVQRGIKRSFVYPERLIREFLDRIGDAVAMGWTAAAENGQDEHIERGLGGIGR